MKKKALIHTSLWLLYLCYDLLTRFLLEIPLSNLHLIIYNLITSIAIFYVFPSFILPGFNQTLNKLAVFLKLTLSFGIFLLARYLFDNFVFNMTMELTEFVISESLRFIYFGFLGTGYWFNKSYIKSLKEQKKQEVQSVKDRLEISNAKISPHFLFNTLNLISGDVYSSSPEASEKIVILSDILRYSLERDNQLVEIKDEIRIMESYLELQEMRFQNGIFFQMNVELNHGLTSMMLPKMMLITVLENIFIHGIFNDPDHPPRVSITSSKHQFHMQVTNKINHSVKKTFSGGVGMSHIDKSLKYFFKGKYIFDQQIEPDTFNLTITINY